MGCWLYLGSRTAAGYGQWGPRGARVYVHRAAYEVLVGPIPDGYQIDHLCRVRNCYNPAHLEAVPHAENIRRQPNVIDQMRRTHCPKGHPYDEANTYRSPRGKRHCRQCRREGMRRGRAA